MQTNKSAILSPGLLKIQNVSEAQIARLLELYEELSQLFDRARDADSDEQCKVIAAELKDLEFQLQDNWNFPRSEDHHSYQFRLPGCTCPKIDNAERFGTPYKIITTTCKFHGDCK